jgi:hypothetical protein
VLTVNVLIPGARGAELILQALLVLFCGLFGSFGRGGDDDDDSGRPA